MRTARYLTLLALAVALSLILAGCGGGGGGGGIDARYVGAWTAAWNTPGTTDAGTGNIGVTNSGGVSGSLTNQTTHITFDVSGDLANNGVFEGSFTYPDSTTYTTRGQINIVSAGLEGVLTVYSASNTPLATVNITLTRSGGVPVFPL